MSIHQKMKSRKMRINVYPSLSHQLMEDVNQRILAAARILGLICSDSIKPCPECTGHVRDKEAAKSLRQMVDHFEKYPIPDPDFAKGVDTQPLTSSSLEIREVVLENIEARLTGLAPDEAGDVTPPKFDLRIDDLCSQDLPQTFDRTVSLDLDSGLAFDFPLYMIHSDISLNTLPSSGCQLKSNLHFRIGKTMAHQVPHFHLGSAGEGLDFDIFIMLPNYPRFQSKYNNHTYISSETQKAFFNKMLIPASKCLSSGLRVQWSSNYDQEKAKSRAKQEGKKVDKMPEGESMEWNSNTMEARKDLPAQYTKRFWEAFQRSLNAAIAEGKELKHFEGFQLLLTGKNWKYRIFEESGDMRKLLQKMNILVCSPSSMKADDH